MGWKCNTCGNTRRFQAVVDSITDVIIDGDEQIDEILDTTVQHIIDVVSCDECGSENLTVIEDEEPIYDTNESDEED